MERLSRCKGWLLSFLSWPPSFPASQASAVGAGGRPLSNSASFHFLPGASAVLDSKALMEGVGAASWAASPGPTPLHGFLSRGEEVTWKWGSSSARVAWHHRMILVCSGLRQRVEASPAGGQAPNAKLEVVTAAMAESRGEKDRKAPRPGCRAKMPDESGDLTSEPMESQANAGGSPFPCQALTSPPCSACACVWV